MTVLSHQSIKRMCRGPRPLIEDYEEGQVRTASYDLRLGEEFFLSSNPGTDGCVEIRSLDGRRKKILEIPPNQVVVIRTIEGVNMPNNLVGHLSIKLDLLLHGVIMSCQSQIDVGYRGPIFALLYNLSSHPVAIALGESVLRLEFAKVDHPSAQTYHGSYRPDFGLADVVRRSLTSSLSAMSSHVKTLQRFTYIGAATVILTIAGILATLLGPIQQQSSDAEASSRSTEQAAITLRAQVDTMRAEIAILQSRIAEVDQNQRSQPVCARVE